jgi:hypothetical protein
MPAELSVAVKRQAQRDGKTFFYGAVPEQARLYVLLCIWDGKMGVLESAPRRHDAASNSQKKTSAEELLILLDKSGGLIAYLVFLSFHVAWLT